MEGGDQSRVILQQQSQVILRLLRRLVGCQSERNESAIFSSQCITCAQNTKGKYQENSDLLCVLHVYLSSIVGYDDGLPSTWWFVIFQLRCVKNLRALSYEVKLEEKSERIIAKYRSFIT